MSKGKIIAITSGVLFLVAGIVLGIFLVFRNQDIREKAAPATSILISPATQNKVQGATVNLAVQMDTGVNRSLGFDLIINYNPQVFQVTSITKGNVISGFQEIRNNIDSTNGKIYYSVYNADSTKAVQGPALTILNILATVKPTAPAGSYKFSFDTSTAVAGLTEGQNVLIQSNPATVVVGLGVTPTPTSTPIPTSTPTLAPTNNPLSTATPTPFPTYTPIGTASPTLVPTVRPSATPMEIPVTGIDMPTIALILVGAFAIMANIIYFII